MLHFVGECADISQSDLGGDNLCILPAGNPCLLELMERKEERLRKLPGAWGVLIIELLGIEQGNQLSTARIVCRKAEALSELVVLSL